MRGRLTNGKEYAQGEKTMKMGGAQWQEQNVLSDSVCCMGKDVMLEEQRSSRQTSVHFMHIFIGKWQLNK